MHFCGAKVRLAKTAQYIAVFRLRAVAPYLPAPRTVDRKIEAPASNSLGSRGTPSKLYWGAGKIPAHALLRGKSETR